MRNRGLEGFELYLKYHYTGKQVITNRGINAKNIKEYNEKAKNLDLNSWVSVLKLSFDVDNTKELNSKMASYYTGVIMNIFGLPCKVIEGQVLSRYRNNQTNEDKSYIKHFWNELNGTYFDLSLDGILDDNRLNEYYIIENSIEPTAVYDINRILDKEYQNKTKSIIDGNKTIGEQSVELFIGVYLSNLIEEIQRNEPIIEE